MADIRAIAEDILSAVPKTGEIRSNGPTGATFTSMTDTPQSMMQANWDKGGKMTACNGFVGWYARTLRGKLPGTKAPSDYLGRFDLATYLPSIHMGHAWVKSTPDVRPKFGDICRHTTFHVGVSLDFDGDFWNHADAGQGGRGIGCDILKRTKGDKPYDYKNLEGWIDIEMYYGSSPQIGRIPDWLAAWWTVTWRTQTYYYFFNVNRKVKYTQLRPRDTMDLPLVSDDTGNFAVDGTNVMIRWMGTGTIERFTQKPGTDDEMTGTWNGKEPLYAKRMP